MTKSIGNRRTDAWRTDVDFFLHNKLSNCPLSLVAVSYKLQIHVSVRLLTIKASSREAEIFGSNRKNTKLWLLITKRHGLRETNHHWKCEDSECALTNTTCSNILRPCQLNLGGFVMKRKSNYSLTLMQFSVFTSHVIKTKIVTI